LPIGIEQNEQMIDVGQEAVVDMNKRSQLPSLAPGSQRWSGIRREEKITTATIGAREEVIKSLCKQKDHSSHDWRQGRRDRLLM
jgi:hypothetical protein